MATTASRASGGTSSKARTVTMQVSGKYTTEKAKDPSGADVVSKRRSSVTGTFPAPALPVTISCPPLMITWSKVMAALAGLVATTIAKAAVALNNPLTRMEHPQRAQNAATIH
jgi:hypothetical protein